MGNQGCIYLVMFGSRSWLNFGINPYHYFVLDCVCKVCWWELVLFICLTWSSMNAKHHLLYGTAPLCGSCLSLFCRFDQPESIFFAFAASHHRLARLCDIEPNSEPVSPSETNTLRNDPKFGCVVIMSGMTTIWVHMAVLVWSTICYQRKQAVVLIWIILVSQTGPYVAEFHHAA